MVALGTHQPELSAGPRDRFARLLRAEWTKFRTVPGWIITILVAAALPTGFALLNMGQCGGCTAPLTGPGGGAVTDQFSFVHRALAGNGSITVRVTSLTGLYSSSGGGESAAGGPLAQNPTAGWTPDIEPWSKAGIIIKASTTPGSAYAAMMVTGSHGVRMQWNYTGDIAGLGGTPTTASPRWLRLVRHGEHCHRLRLRRRHQLDQGRHRHPHRPAGHRPGRAVRGISRPQHSDQPVPYR